MTVNASVPQISDFFSEVLESSPRESPLASQPAPQVIENFDLVSTQKLRRPNDRHGTGRTRQANRRAAKGCLRSPRPYRPADADK